MNLIIHSEIIKMQNELNDLVFEYESLKNQICPMLENRYLIHFGLYEYKLYSRELKLSMLKMKFRLIMVEKNHQRKIDLAEIDEKVNDKFEIYMDRLSQYIDESIEAIDKNNYSRPLSEKEIIHIKEIYRKIVKKTHPDLNKDLGTFEKGIFTRANQAFKNGDIKELESLLFSLSDSNEDAYTDFDKLTELILEFRNRIDKIKNDYPYNKRDFLLNKQSIEDYKHDLLDLIDDVESQIKIYEDKINNVEFND